ncbi:hypothetical protein WJ0W_000324 [Paenibacillus melissococcoides]|uniref:Uncharacterized protein n=1 Tax=Paenibacillus melissococcoides TaxID=2912268 RepID=A0ABM9FVB5_9BACL|nr:MULTISPECIES: hypothetical protein [Paenibacillus]MEB9894354.1 hypothetical protein [Bacillus cereus]CAH8243097.1 hypothetical protein WJ0W_000324 [Paenibacillus melissococcoides]CAH8703744.1 hypothetical protein WDD9_000318 [Paenibacillus melissococcoides]CAH8706776.1 hypothetical protein HTL2_001402 [Paenibacillus melissococcoides]GIO77287.1 hypothetical protein J6TS7_08970 [Paenibacillus dendritiformis]
MIPIPLDEEVIRSHCGRIVCAVTHDGRRFIGRLSLCRDGKIILNEEEVPEEVQPIIEEECEPKKKRRKRRVKRVKRPCKPVKRPCKPCSGKKGSVTSVQPYGAFPASYPAPHPGVYSRGRIELDLSLIALLFLVLI